MTAPEKLPDVWASRDYPVLLEVVRRLDEGAVTVRLHEVVEALGMSEQDVERAGVALERRGLVETRGMDHWRVFDFTDASGEAYMLTGLHPDGDDAVSRLVSALRLAADQTSDPVEKGRLRGAADHLGTIGRDVLGGVMTAVLTGGMGG